MSKDWYNERNKRTDSFAEVNEGWHNIKVSVVVTADNSNYNTQVMLKVLLNILARWCYNVAVTCADTPSILAPDAADIGLLKSLNKMLSGIDPNGNFSFNNSANKNPDITIFIGEPITGQVLP